MKKFLIITREKIRFSIFYNYLENKGYFVSWADSVESGLEAIAADPPAVSIIDETVDGQTCFDLAKKIIEKNVFINLVLVSQLPENIFHDKAEGLGILTRIPLTPDSGHAEKIITAFKALL